MKRRSFLAMLAGAAAALVAPVQAIASQRGHLKCQFQYSAVNLNEAWMRRLESPVGVELYDEVRRQVCALHVRSVRRHIFALDELGHGRPIEASWIAVVHPDAESDVRGLPGFLTAGLYPASTCMLEDEIGVLMSLSVRVITDPRHKGPIKVYGQDGPLPRCYGRG